jgi:hypothetical protein
MKILVFTEGTIIMHGNNRKDFASHVPISNSVKKLKSWNKQGAEILYLTSRKEQGQINDIKNVLKKFNFPAGKLLFRKNGEQYGDVVERIMPDVIIEDDCKSIGGEKEMTFPNLKPELKKRIKSIVVKEFAGIDALPENVSELLNY